MSGTFLIAKRAVTFRGGKFVECVYVELRHGLKVTRADEGILIALKDQEFVKQFAQASISADSITFLVLDLSEKDFEAQIIGCTRSDPFIEEPTPHPMTYFFA